MKKKLKVGIAGYGVVGKKRRAFIDANLNFVTVAVSDVNFEKDHTASDGVRCFNSYKKIIKEDLDVLFVCLPNYLAPEATIGGLRNNMHVFCEKPPGRTVADIKNVIAEEKKHPNLKLKYGFNHRYHQSVIEAKKIIDSKIYGDVINIRGVYGKSRMITSLGGWRAKRKYAGGGILLDQGIHMLDMILYFAGDFPEVKSFISNRHWGHDVEDNAYAIMKNKAGRVAMLHSTATQWQHKFRLEIALQEALVELTGILSGSKSYGEERLMVMRRKDDSMVGSLEGKTVSYLEDNSWKSEVDEFADIIVKNKKVVNGNSADALRAMEMVYRIYRADSNWKKTFNV